MRLSVPLVCVFWATGAAALSVASPNAWVVVNIDRSSAHPLVGDAIPENGFGAVTQSGQTAVARQQSIAIPDIRVFAASNNVSAA